MLNYQNIYNQLIESAKKRKKPDSYCEIHHIIPKSLGGSNDKNNLVSLTAREHFIAHRLLCKIYPKDWKLSFALLCMSSEKSKSAVGHKISSREYEYARNLFSKHMKISHPNKGKTASLQTRKKMSDSSRRLSGSDHPMFGKKHSDQSKEKMSRNSKRLSGKDHAMFGRKQSDSARNKMSEHHAKSTHTRWNFDKTIYTFKSIKTNESFTGLRFDFCKKYNLSTTNGAISGLIKGYRKVIFGEWILERNENDSTS